MPGRGTWRKSFWSFRIRPRREYANAPLARAMRRPIKVKEMICQSAPARRRREVGAVERGWWERRVPCSSRAWEGRVSSSSSSSSAREWRGGDEEDILVRGICEEVDERIDCGHGWCRGGISDSVAGRFDRRFFVGDFLHHPPANRRDQKKQVFRARVCPTVIFSTPEHLLLEMSRFKASSGPFGVLDAYVPNIIESPTPE